MKEFKLSDYPNRLNMQYDKDKYLDKLIKAMAGRLIEIGEVLLDDNNRLIWRSNGGFVAGEE